MVIDNLNLTLRQIARFLSNVILDEMSSAKCCLLVGFFLIAQHEERPLYHVHMVTSRYIDSKLTPNRRTYSCNFNYDRFTQRPGKLL